MAEPVAPAFPVRFQRLIFAVAVLGLVALPFLLEAAGRPTLRERFRSVPATGGDFAAIEHVVLDESADIDVLVLGTSYLWAAIDTPFLEKSLSAELGRAAVARSIGSNFRGEEMYFMLLREVLLRRKVGVLVLSMPSVRDRRDAPHPYAHRISGPGFLSLYDGLPLRYRTAALGEYLLGAPRHALSLLRAERTETSPLLSTNGALLRRAGFSGAAFEEHFEDPPSLGPAELVYGPTTKERFCFSRDPLNPIQHHFTDKTIALARSHGVRVVIVNVPTWGDRNPDAPTEAEAWADCVPERLPYPEVFGDVTLVGVPHRKLFGHMTTDRAKLLFYSGHMNSNGARYLTQALLPALLEAAR